MDKVQSSSLKMRQQLKVFINATDPAIIALCNKIADIMVDLQKQKAKKAGLTKNKAAIRQNLTALAINLAAILQSYATSIDDLTLHFNMAYTKSQLDKLPSVRLIAICSLIARAANANIAALSGYQVTAASMAEFILILESFEKADPKPRAGKLVKQGATLAIKTALKDSKALLLNMDGVVRTLSIKQPTFVEDYFRVRKLIALPTTLMALRGKITNEAGKPMPFVHITCEGLKLFRKASKTGSFIIKNAPDGVYLFTFEFPGYQTVVREVCIYAGIRTELKVIMQLL